MLIMWELWKERNARVFETRESSTISLFAKIKEEANAWIMVGSRHLESFLARENRLDRQKFGFDRYYSIILCRL